MAAGPLLRAIALACGFSALAVSELGCTRLADRPDVVIGTASPTSLYYPLGGSLCRLFNLDTPRHGLRCSEAASAGSIANIDALDSGRIDIGIVQSDVLAEAASGQGPFTSRGADPELRILFAGHDEMLTVVAQQELGIRTVAELRGKRVNIGNPGSRQRAYMDRVMAALGLARTDFAEVRELAPAEQNRAFCANELDAIVYSVAHPNGLIQDVARTCGGMLVDVSGPRIDELLSDYTEYERTVIPGGTYAGNPMAVRTFGVRAVVVATARVSDTVAYEITKAVFDNFDDFRHLHPAFETLSVTDMVRIAGRAPVHAGTARYYRERGWAP